MAGTRTILLVEDEIIIAMNEMGQLKKEGYQVVHVSSGEKALEQTRRDPGKIDLILMDIDLGKGMDGAQAAQEILKQQDIPIVFLSSHTEPEIVEKTEQITSYGYVVKNSGITVLTASIKMAFKLHAARLALQQVNQELEGEIAGRMRTEEALRASEKNLRDAQHLTHIGSWQWIIATDTVNWSEELYHINGRNPDLPAPRYAEMAMCYTPESWARLQAAVARAVQTGEPYELEIEIVRTDGVHRLTLSRGEADCEADGKIIGLHGTVQDITEQKQAEIALQLSEEKFSKAFLFSPDAIMITRITDGKIIEVNEGFSRLSEYSRAEALASSSIDLNLWANLHDRDCCVAALREHRVVRDYEFKFRIKSGKKLDCLYSGELITLSGETYVLSVIRDITESKQAEDALHASEERLRQIIEQMPYPVEICDPNGAAQMVNQAFLKMFDIPSADLIVKKYNVFEDRLVMNILGVAEEVRRVYAGEQVFIPELAIPAAKKQPELGVGGTDTIVLETTMFPVFRAAGEIWGVVTIWKDISDRKKAENALRESEERFRVLFEGAPDAIFLADPESGKILEANRAASRLLAKPIEAIVGMNQAELHPPKVEDFSKESFHRHIQEAQSQGYTQPVETIALRADNAQVPVEVVAQVVQINGRGVLMGTFRDITERKRAEDQIKALLGEKEVLLREVHHRIKNNMSIIASLLAMQADAQEESVVRKALQDAVARIKSMMVLYDKLYRSENFGAISLQDYLPPLLHQVVGLFSYANPVSIHTQVEDILLSPKMLSPLGIILTELTTNAMKYAFPGRSDGTITVTARREAEEVSIIFQDNGVGMPETFCLESSNSFGMQLIDLLVKQLRGSLAIEMQHGAKIKIKFQPE